MRVHAASTAETMRRFLIILLVVLSLVLLFWRLDGADLWRDEATTANWGRLMAESGSWLPHVFDGRQLIAQASDGHDFNSQLLPAMQSWLQFYVAAAGFKVFGVSTAAARIPFALLGALCLFVFYRMGIVLFGAGQRALLLPYLGILSLFFLFAARQSRYYILVVLAAALLLLEFFRYLRSPELASQASFYLRVGLYGVVLYLSNYLSFAGMWASLLLFVLLLRDARLRRGFLLLTGGMALILGLEFWCLHAEFAGVWPPPRPAPLLETYGQALIAKGSELWQATPLIFLVPAGFYLCWARDRRPSIPVAAGAGAALLAVLLPLTPWVSRAQMSAAGPVHAGGFLLLCFFVPVAFWLCWRRLGSPGLWAHAALLAGLILAVSPLVTVAAAKLEASTRHYFQILPAALVLGALAVAAVREANHGRWAMALFAGILIWPNLAFNYPWNEAIVERQFARDRSHSEPLLDFLRLKTQPGDKIAFYRNVQGMTAYFYLPEMHWVALLDSEAPHNQKFRGRLPDDQFDDFAGADWYVVWDPRGGWPKQLDKKHFEKVWEHSYEHRVNLWHGSGAAGRRTYEVYRRVSGVSPEETR